MCLFFGGSQPLCVIRSDSDGPCILVIRDSYADCLMPFLSQRFSEVHRFDLRYNRSNVQAYIRANKIDAVFFDILISYSYPEYLYQDYVNVIYSRMCGSFFQRQIPRVELPFLRFFDSYNKKRPLFIVDAPRTLVSTAVAKADLSTGPCEFCTSVVQL